MTLHDLPVVPAVEESGAVLRLLLNRPKGNVLDREMIELLVSEAEALRDRPEILAVLFEGAGSHFSFGASVEEHRADEVAEFLPRFHHLFRMLAASGRVLVSAVQGYCLGGGLELASFCHRVFAAPTVRLGNPEIQLGVIAPVASVVLPWRVGPNVAEDLLLSGRELNADEAFAMGLVDVIAQDPGAAARAWIREHLLDKSGAALRATVAASRDHLHLELDGALTRIERMYLDELMKTSDANEGIEAFLEKRKPTWKHA